MPQRAVPWRSLTLTTDYIRIRSFVLSVGKQKTQLQSEIADTECLYPLVSRLNSLAWSRRREHGRVTRERVREPRESVGSGVVARR
eukprot:6181455-Pleurochrysis_carterae.AAC.1